VPMVYNQPTCAAEAVCVACSQRFWQHGECGSGVIAGELVSW
jgi:hypothetical protein